MAGPHLDDVPQIPTTRTGQQLYSLFHSSLYLLETSLVLDLSLGEIKQSTEWL